MNVWEESENDHKITFEELYHRYSTDPNTGLTDDKAKEILNRDGPNALSKLKRTPEAIKVFGQIFGGFALLFWICAILCFIVHGLKTITHFENTSISYLWIGIVLIIVVIINAFFSYFQELEISRIFDKMTYMAPQKTIVIRNGEKKIINIEDLVVGDIIEVNSGVIIPADIRIVESNGFKVNNSCLTGESEPQTRSIEFTNENQLETKNLLFQSTFAVEGSAKGVVIRTGDRTVRGRIANSIPIESTVDAPITKEIAQSISSITGVAIFLGISFFIMAISLGYPFIESLILLIVMIIVNAPKSLSIIVTICLTLIAKRMARKNCLIKNLETVETLGSTSIICVDKTGVLTRNKMAISHMWFDNRIVQVDNTKDQPSSTHDKTSPAFLALARCVMLCNRADFKQDSENLARSTLEREYIGDASEVALLKYVELSIGNVSEFREVNRKVFEIPFNSTNKYHLSIHEVHNNNPNDGNPRSYLLVMKGAPERIIERCSTIFIDEKDVEMNDYWREAMNRAYLEVGNLGERVLGFCDLRLSDNEYPYGYSFDVDQGNFPTENLRFLGFMSMIDPPRVNVPDAIRRCQSAGIQLIMVTGDHPITAKAIARAVGVISEGSETVEDIAACLNIPSEQVALSDAKARVIHGNDLRGLSEAEIDALLKDDKEIVFARTSPQQKVIIVKACKQQGAIVTMIGDGVNDSPALQQADVAIAVGINSSYISRQSADIILMDDNFASILTCVEQGRLMFDNLKKSIAYTMTSNIVKIISVLICLLTDIPLTWTITSVLFIDLMNIIGAISLVYQKAETDIMKRRPRNPQYDRLVNKRLILIAYGLIGIIQVVAGLFAYFLTMTDNNFLPLRLSNLRNVWKSETVSNLQNSYDQQWTGEQRKQIEFTCYIAFFMTIIICQWATLIIFKNRRDSIMQQSINNLMLNYGMIFETILAAIISSFLYFNTSLNTYPLKFSWWLPALSYAFIILICDELRKYIIRKHPGSVVERETSY